MWKREVREIYQWKENCETDDNDNKKCTAGHIQIAGVKAVSTGETECGTFQCK